MLFRNSITQRQQNSLGRFALIPFASLRVKFLNKNYADI